MPYFYVFFGEFSAKNADKFEQNSRFSKIFLFVFSQALTAIGHPKNTSIFVSNVQVALIIGGGI